MSDTFAGKQRVSAAFKKTFTDKDPELDRVPAISSPMPAMPS